MSTFAGCFIQRIASVCFFRINSLFIFESLASIKCGFYYIAEESICNILFCNSVRCCRCHGFTRSHIRFHQYIRCTCVSSFDDHTCQLCDCHIFCFIIDVRYTDNKTYCFTQLILVSICLFIIFLHYQIRLYRFLLCSICHSQSTDRLTYCVVTPLSSVWCGFFIKSLLFHFFLCPGDFIGIITGANISLRSCGYKTYSFTFYETIYFTISC